MNEKEFPAVDEEWIDGIIEAAQDEGNTDRVLNGFIAKQVKRIADTLEKRLNPPAGD